MRCINFRTRSHFKKRSNFTISVVWTNADQNEIDPTFNKDIQQRM
jgi:hypothetical protein